MRFVPLLFLEALSDFWMTKSPADGNNDFFLCSFVSFVVKLNSWAGSTFFPNT